MSPYKERLTQAMAEIAMDSRVVFLGQGVRYEGVYYHDTLPDQADRLEMPVAEEMQLGIAIGMSLAGLVPVCLYPRWNFLFLAMNQLVNHLDVMEPHVIVRVGIGTEKPLDPGPQHTGSFFTQVRDMLKNTRCVSIGKDTDAVAVYRNALAQPGPWLIEEDGRLYG